MTEDKLSGLALINAHTTIVIDEPKMIDSFTNSRPRSLDIVH